MASQQSSPREVAAEPGPNADSGRVGRLSIEEFDGRRALVSDGVIFSVEAGGDDPPFGYWTAMLPDGGPANGLLLGLGAGTLAQLLTRRFPGISLVGVDNDPELLAFAREHFDLDLPNLEVVVADAFEYVARCDRRFDFVAVDLFVGSSFERGVLSRPFLRRLKSLAAADGEVVFNLYRNRRSESYQARIQRVLPVARVDRLSHNVIVHCRFPSN